MKEIVTDLKAEQESLDTFLSALSDEQWELATPAEGWTVKDSASHIAYIDEVAVSVLRGDNTFLEEVAGDVDRLNNIGLKKGRLMKPAEVMSRWRNTRQVMLDELLKRNPREKLPWLALPMGARAFTTARLMETWAHGLDCYDATGTEPEDTGRLRHIAMLAYLVRPYAYQINGLRMPETPLCLNLRLPSGAVCSFGPGDAVNIITGEAGDFCRVAVHRRHWQDTGLDIKGDEARRFIEIVQTYAGPPGPGRNIKRP